MNEIKYNEFKKTEEYNDFIKNNPENGYLNIRAYAANSAIPITGLEVKVSGIVNNQKIIFFEGKTDNSGLISNINLPTPRVNSNDEIEPLSSEYEVSAKYNDENLVFKVVMYANISVLQNISVVPNLRLDGGIYGR